MRESKKIHSKKCSCGNFTLVINKIQWNLPTAEPQGQYIFLCKKVPFHKGTWIVDPWNCKTFPVKTVFPYPQVPFNTSFAVFISLFIRRCTLMSALSCLLLTATLWMKTYVQSLNIRWIAVIRQVFDRQNYLQSSATVFDDVFRNKYGKVVYGNAIGSYLKAYSRETISIEWAKGHRLCFSIVSTSTWWLFPTCAVT